MKKTRKALALVIIFALLLCGCGGSQGATAPEQDSAEGEVSEATSEVKTGEKVKVRILTRYSNPDSVREKYFMDMVEKFQKENPDIELEDVSISDEESRDTLFKTSVASGDPIEVFNFLGYASNLEYVENGVVTDVAATDSGRPSMDRKLYRSPIYTSGLFIIWG